MKKILTIAAIVLTAMTAYALPPNAEAARADAMGLEAVNSTGKIMMKLHRKSPRPANAAPVRHLPVDVSYDGGERNITITTSRPELQAHVYLYNDKGEVVDHAPVLATQLRLPEEAPVQDYKVYIDGDSWYAIGKIKI